MKIALDIGLARPGARPIFDPVGMLLRLDAAYRDSRRCDALTLEQLRDIGLSRSDFARLSRRER